MLIAQMTTPDPELAKWGLAVLGIVACLTLIAACIVGVTAIKNQSHDSKRIQAVINAGLIVRMGTIFGIVMTAGLLALSGTLTDGAIAILSGIAGYVLGGIERTQPAESANLKSQVGSSQTPDDKEKK